jgi:hypothetical protein
MKKITGFKEKIKNWKVVHAYVFTPFAMKPPK